MYAGKEHKDPVSRIICGPRQRVKHKEKNPDLLQGIFRPTPQFADRKFVNIRPVSQLMAWVITRELNLGFSGSSNSKSSSSRAPSNENPAGSFHGSSDRSGGAVSSGIALSPVVGSVAGLDSLTVSSSEHGSKQSTSRRALANNSDTLDGKHIINQQSRNLDLQNKPTLLGKIFALKFHHRHILFDKSQNLPVVGKSNNIGYGGVLYKESSLEGYQKNNLLSKNDIYIEKEGTGNNGSKKVEKEDQILIWAIDKNQDYGPYNLLTHNCQHWVNDVNKTFEERKTKYTKKNKKSRKRKQRKQRKYRHRRHRRH